MILICPSCSARFNVKVEALGTRGRIVKCSKCAHQWHAMPESNLAPARLIDSPETASPSSSRPEFNVGEKENNNVLETHSSPRRKTSYQQPQRENSTLSWWFALVTLIAVLSSASIIWREEIVELYPPANEIFTMINMPVEIVVKGEN